MDLKETDVLGDNISKHWYYKSKAKAMRSLLGDIGVTTILDVGAGSGFFSRHLLANTSATNAWCVDISYESDRDEREQDKAIYMRRSIDNLDADLVLLMDVLEHVDDDVGLLSTYVDKVPAGARFLISVPAFQCLWSEHDVFLEHRRRYKLDQLEDVVRQSGLKILTGAYFFGAVFPIAAAIRLASTGKPSHHGAKSQLSMHSPFINSVLNTLCNLELPFLKSNRLAGLTAFCLAEKI